MKWCNFLHFYQPAGQQKDILEAVVNQCYKPVFKGLLNEPRACLTINISGGLLEALDKNGFDEVLADLRNLYDTGRVEVTSTACYHAFLPLLPEAEIQRQIEINNELLKNYLGAGFSPKGFFPPEMAYDPKMARVVEKMGFEYILLDEIAHRGGDGEIDTRNIYQIKDSDLKVFYRQRNPSNIIMSGIERDSSSISGLVNKYSEGSYLVTAMDGETFGHHRPGLERQLMEVFRLEGIEFCRISQLLDGGLPVEPTEPLSSTWASSMDDFKSGIQFISWNDPTNVIHGWQWELVYLMLEHLHNADPQGSNYNHCRELADRALASDQFFWASAKPWWSLEMIEAGAYQCMEVIEGLEGVPEEAKQKARDLYRNIIAKAMEWQRTGMIREMNKNRSLNQRIPFKTRTLEGGGVEPAIYNAFIDMMKEQEKLAASKGEYEKAILWRDAVYKIETKNDIYDAINAIDLLRIEVSNEHVEKVLDEYTARYKQIRGGQPEQRSN